MRAASFYLIEDWIFYPIFPIVSRETGLPERREQNVPTRLSRLRFYLRQRPVMLGWLTALAIVFFLLVAELTHIYQDQRQSIGNRWFDRGVAELKAERYDAAVSDFRAALLYSRDNYAYQLNLAEALLGIKHTAEASAYLLNLWDRQPEDGLVNLELARIAAQRGQTQQAVRYYHDAVNAAWPAEQEPQRRQARLELIDLLLRNNAKDQAQAELIAIAANTQGDETVQQLVAELFMRADDYEHALTIFRQLLKDNPRNPKALAGAGQAAYELGQYSFAEHYLQEAVKLNPNDHPNAERLNAAEMVLRMDPFRRQISPAERNRLVIQAFTIAGQRLEKCAVPSGDASTGHSTSTLSDQWSELKPQITNRALQKNPALVEQAIDLVFRIEQQTSQSCGAPTGPDLALLLISNLHEGSSF